MRVSSISQLLVLIIFLNKLIDTLSDMISLYNILLSISWLTWILYSGDTTL